MLPMFSVYRSGNISESVVEDTFGILKTAISAKRVFVILGSILIGVIVLVYCAVRQTQVIENVKKQSLL